MYQVLVSLYQIGTNFILQLCQYLIKEHCDKISPVPSALNWKQYSLEKWLLETINTNGSLPCQLISYDLCVSLENHLFAQFI